MNQANLMLTLNLETNAAIQEICQSLIRRGLQVEPIFNLQSARASHPRSICPIHDIGPCDCQLVVLLIYANNAPPLTLLAQGFDGQTNFSIAENSLSRSASALAQSVRQVLLAHRDNFND